MLSKPSMPTQEIAGLLQVRERTARCLIHAQELLTVRLGREIHVAVKDLETSLNAHEARESR